MRIPEEKISEILNAADIVDLISDVVNLKRSGKNFFGLCPFHSEKTPSFSVSPDKQIFHCFGCSAGGNAFSFIMKYHGLSFPEAAVFLARKFDIAMESVELDPSQRKKMQMKEGVFRVNQNVRDFFFHQLQNEAEAAPARDYLEKRGITQEIIDTFGIGFAPDAWDSVVQLLRKMRLSRSVAEASGLVLPRKNGSGYYDRFRNRIVFPIIDVNMQVAGFGGRVMDESMPKYLNSPETVVYSKGRILYGLHAARQYCRQQGDVYIVEGYFDFISLYQYGVKNCVATLGTALTDAHVRLLKGYASRMILVFDSDDAGVNAAVRGVELFLKEGVEVRILVLPEGQDPDSFIRAHGKEAFQRAAQKTMTVMAFLTQTAIKRHGLSIEGKVAVLNEISQYLVSVRESATRSLYIRDLSHKLGIDEKAVMEKVKEHFNRPQNRIGRGGPGGLEKGDGRWQGSGRAGTPSHPVGGSAIDSNQRQHAIGRQFSDAGGADGTTEYLVDTGANKRERQIVAMMIQFPVIIEEVKSRNLLAHFFSARLKALGELVIVAADSGSPERVAADAMATAENEEDRELMASLAMMELAGEDDLLKKSIFLMNRVIHVRQKHENSLTNEIRKVEQSDKTDFPLELLRQRQKEIRQLRGYN